MGHTILSQRQFPSAFKILGYTLLHMLEINTQSVFHEYFTYINTMPPMVSLSMNFQ